jgi:hypothetical protein
VPAEKFIDYINTDKDYWNEYKINLRGIPSVNTTPSETNQHICVTRGAYYPNNEHLVTLILADDFKNLSQSYLRLDGCKNLETIVLNNTIESTSNAYDLYNLYNNSVKNLCIPPIEKWLKLNIECGYSEIRRTNITYYTNNSKITELIIPCQEDIDSIPEGAFLGGVFDSITFETNARNETYIKKINNYAFKNCKINSLGLKIPKGVEEIGENVFGTEYIANLKLYLGSTIKHIQSLGNSYQKIDTVILYAIEPPTMGISNNIRITNLYVPESALEAYQKRQDWRNTCYPNEIKTIESLGLND